MTAGARQSAVIHVDLDGAPNIFRHHGWTYDDRVDLIFETGMRGLLRFLCEIQERATLFVVGSDLKEPGKRALLEEAVSLGHEIASHGLTHAELDCLDEAGVKREIYESRDQLERTLGVCVRGFRAPSYRITREAFETVADAGYEWDSSLFPRGRSRTQIGLVDVPQTPHCPLLDEPLIELPLPAHRPGTLPFHPSYSLLLGLRYFRWSLKYYERKQAPLVLLFHLIDFADPMKEMPRSSWRKRLYTGSMMGAPRKRLLCKRIVEHVRDAFQITTTANLVSEWRTKSRPGAVLGISTTHETGAALYRGRECLAAVSEERLDRVKLSTRYPPERSIKSVVRTAGIEPSEVTDIVVAGIPTYPLLKRLIRNQWDDTVDFHGVNDYVPHGNKLLYRAFAWWRSLGYRKVLSFFVAEYGVRPKLHHVEHHLCHASSAYRTAPFEDALIITADGVGDLVSATVSMGRGGRIKVLHSIPYPHSLGQFYTACTQVLGFRGNRHEGKITGLSGFGEKDPELYEKVRSTIRVHGPGLRLDKRFYSEGIVRAFAPTKMRRGEDLFHALEYRNYKPPLARLLQGYPRESIARVFQDLLEEALVEVIRPFVERTRLRNLCLAGGVFANVKANTKVFQDLGFDQVYIFPNMGDGGLSSGAALEFVQARPSPFYDVYWGPGFSVAEMRRALGLARDEIEFESVVEIESEIATRLAAKEVVAYFDGRMEFGPRALCHRSILCAADDPGTNAWLNKRLGRTEFMPFAPVAMEEHAKELFKDIEGLEHACRFMTVVVECTEFTKERAPAVVHVDGTARPQLVSERTNPRMHSILDHYYRLTGVPLLINTSFNMHEEPIVCSPEDAVRAFTTSRLDCLAMGPFIATLSGKSSLAARATSVDR